MTREHFLNQKSEYIPGLIYSSIVVTHIIHELPYEQYCRIQHAHIYNLRDC